MRELRRMAEANAKPAVREYTPQMCKALLSASCLCCPNDPIQFLENTLVAFQGHADLQDVDWWRFVADAERLSATSSPTLKITANTFYIDPEDTETSWCQSEKAYSHYRTNVTSVCFRKWKRFAAQRQSGAMELTLKMDLAKRHYERKRQQVAFIRWSNCVRLQKRTRDIAAEKLEKMVNAARFKRIIAEWHSVSNDSKRMREHFKRLEKEASEIRCDGLSMFPSRLLLKIFCHLGLQDLLTCAEVCYAWRAVTQTGTLWRQINFSVEKDWLTDGIMKQILQSYWPFIIHINLRGCTALKWPSMKCISEYIAF